MESKECKGCQLFNNCLIKTYLHEIDLECPCSVCLIKGICNKDCKDFILFRTKAEIQKVNIARKQRVDKSI